MTIARGKPVIGIDPRHLHEVIGRAATQDISEDEILDWGMLVIRKT